MMQKHLLKAGDDAVVIFGSSFPNDQEYTQVKKRLINYLTHTGCSFDS